MIVRVNLVLNRTVADVADVRQPMRWSHSEPKWVVLHVSTITTLKTG